MQKITKAQLKDIDTRVFPAVWNCGSFTIWKQGTLCFRVFDTVMRYDWAATFQTAREAADEIIAQFPGELAEEA